METNWIYTIEGEMLPIPPENILLEVGVLVDGKPKRSLAYASQFILPGENVNSHSLTIEMYDRETGDRITDRVYAYRVYVVPEPPPYHEGV